MATENLSERPDELIQNAWNAGLDRRRVIRAGADAAAHLFADNQMYNRTLFWPVPHPLEAVDRWLASERPFQGARSYRPFGSMLVPGMALGYLTDRLVLASRLSGDLRWLALLAAGACWVFVLGLVMKPVIEHSVRSQAAQLDEETAFQRVLAHLRAGMARRPDKVSDAAKRARQQLA